MADAADAKHLYLVPPCASYLKSPRQTCGWQQRLRPRFSHLFLILSPGHTWMQGWTNSTGETEDTLRHNNLILSWQNATLYNKVSYRVERSSKNIDEEDRRRRELHFCSVTWRHNNCMEQEGTPSLPQSALPSIYLQTEVPITWFSGSSSVAQRA